MNSNPRSKETSGAEGVAFALGSLENPYRVVDLTALLNERISCYPTDPSFSKTWHTEIAEQGFCVSKLQMGAHTGTHVDLPLHFLGEGFADTVTMPLQSFMGQAIALERLEESGQDLTVPDLAGVSIQPGDIVLFRTGWDRRMGTPEFFQDEWPGIEPVLMEELIARGAKAVGGDLASVDSPAAIAAGAPAHKLAARAGLPIFEGLVNLDQLISQRFYFIGLPLKIEGGEASPIRAVALAPNVNSSTTLS
jgi:kynurenine formamidase